jgi:hypothetical protein
LVTYIKNLQRKSKGIEDKTYETKRVRFLSTKRADWDHLWED